jgi:hypothetical protein
MRGLCSLRMPNPLPARIIAGIAFVGRGGGQVKQLSGFKKGHHTVPNGATAATQAFLGKICAPELEERAERLFQEARTAFAYKRKEISLNVAAPLATLNAKDFTVEMVYAIDETDGGRYLTTTTLQELHNWDVARGEPLGRLFAAAFTEISFALSKGASVEAVIDAVESLNGKGGLTVNYPSECRECVIAVSGVDAEVRCTGGSLDMVFSRGGSPAELIDAFEAVREAFQVSSTLSALVG